MNLNKVFLLGRLTADPQLRSTTNGRSVVNFSLATNRIWLNRNGERQQDTQFHNVVVWGKQAEVAHQFLKKGSLVLVEGHLQNRSWQGQDGQNRKVVEVICERLQLGPRSLKENIGELETEPEFSPVTTEFNGETEVPDVNLDEEQTLENENKKDIPF